MSYHLADTYADATILETFEKDNHTYAKIKRACPRCGGTGHYAYCETYGTTCFTCNGKKLVLDVVRAYDDSEYAAYLKQKEKAAEKKQQAADARRKKNREEFKAKHGFNDYSTFVYYGETYAIKDMLKENGAKFDYILGWHSPNKIDVPEGTFVIEVPFTDIYADDTYEQYPDAKEKIEKLTILPDEEFANSDFVGAIGEKLILENVNCSDIHGYTGYYGDGNVYVFNYNGNKITWFTTSAPGFIVGGTYKLQMIVKKQDTYKGIKQTTVTRVKEL